MAWFYIMARNWTNLYAMQCACFYSHLLYMHNSIWIVNYLKASRILVASANIFFFFYKKNVLTLDFFSDACHPYEPFRCPGDGRCISIQYLCDGAPGNLIFYVIWYAVCVGNVLLLLLNPWLNLYFIHSLFRLLGCLWWESKIVHSW